MHSGDLSEMNQASLSEQEKEALLEVMERAKVRYCRLIAVTNNIILTIVIISSYLH